MERARDGGRKGWRDGALVLVREVQKVRLMEGGWDGGIDRLWRGMDGRRQGLRVGI